LALGNMGFLMIYMWVSLNIPIKIFSWKNGRLL